jgi:hypothetical protein
MLRVVRLRQDKINTSGMSATLCEHYTICTDRLSKKSSHNGSIQRIHPLHLQFITPSSPFNIALQSTLTTLRNSIPKADSNSNNKRKTKEGRTPLVVVANSNAPLDLVDAPQVDAHGVEQSQAGDESERPRGRERDGVAKVEQSGGDGAEDDGEFELGRYVSWCDLVRW